MNPFEKTMLNLAESAAKAAGQYEEAIRKVGEVASNFNDYIGDGGLLYCGNCKTPKQVRVTLPSGKYIQPYCLCRCAAERRDKAERDLREYERIRTIQKRRHSLIKDDKLLSYTFEKDARPESKYSKIFRRYCDKWEQVKENNTGLILWGDTGRGKSFYAGCIANRMIDKGVAALATTEPKLINELFSAKDKVAFIEKIVSYPLLIIDDFGASRETSYSREQLFTLIDERYKTNLPIVFTTNLTPMQLDSPKGIDEQRIYERVKSMGTLIEVSGINWRQKEAQQKAEELMDILKE